MKTILTAKRNPNNREFITVDYAPTPATTHRIGVILSDGSFVPDGPIIYPELMQYLAYICNNFYFFFCNIKND